MSWKLLCYLKFIPIVHLNKWNSHWYKWSKLWIANKTYGTIFLSCFFTFLLFTFLLFIVFLFLLTFWFCASGTIQGYDCVIEPLLYTYIYYRSYQILSLERGPGIHRQIIFSARRKFSRHSFPDVRDGINIMYLHFISMSFVYICSQFEALLLEQSSSQMSNHF